MVISRQARIPFRGRFARGRFSVPAVMVEQLELRSPANPSDVIAVFGCGEDDVPETVASAVDAQAAWQRLGADARGDVLLRIELSLRPQLAELAIRMQRELGRPAWECERELGGLVPRLRDVVELARCELDDRKLHAGTRLQRRPLGVVAVLGPVMFPLATSHAAIVAALMAGNTVVWKPSPLVAASAQLYAEALSAAGLPAGVFNLVQGGAQVGERLVLHPQVNGVVFAGSADNARALRRLSADRLELKTILHSGAKNSALVLDDADVDPTVSELVHGAFATAGQRPSAIGRVLVQANVLEPFLELLVHACRRLVVDGGGTTRKASFGPMFSKERVDRFQARLAAAEADGARVVLRSEARGCLVRPSIHVVEDPRHAVAYRTEELFGPDLVVEPVTDVAEALERLRGHGGLYASCFTQSHKSWRAFSAGVQSGALLWNHSPMSVSARIPLAAAGRESARGLQALLALTREAAVCDASTAPALPFVVAEEPLVEPRRLAPPRIVSARKAEVRR